MASRCPASVSAHSDGSPGKRFGFLHRPLSFHSPGFVLYKRLRRAGPYQSAFAVLAHLLLADISSEPPCTRLEYGNRPLLPGDALRPLCNDPYTGVGTGAREALGQIQKRVRANALDPVPLPAELPSGQLLHRRQIGVPDVHNARQRTSCHLHCIS